MRNGWRLRLPGLVKHVDSDTSQRSAYIGKMLQARYHGFFTSDDAFIIYTFLLLWPSYQTQHSFLRLINQDLSSSRLCWYTKGTWHISFSPVKHNIQKTSILAQKLVLLLRGKNIHYNSVKLEALLRLETGNWFLFCLFWFLLFYFIQ